MSPRTDTTATPDERSCCTDFTASRRSLLKTATAIGGGLTLSRLFGESVLHASFGGARGGNTLVVLSLRGGIDGLGVVVPHGDPGYYRARPTTAVPAASLICKDAMFGLHPKLAPLAKYWESGELAAVQAVGMRMPNRSHFTAIEAIEDAAPGSTARTGWINRMVGMGSSGSPVDGVRLGSPLPTAALRGPAPTLATAGLTRLQIPGLEAEFESQRLASQQLAWGSSDNPLAAGVRSALSLSRNEGAVLKSAPAGTVSYPSFGPATAFAAPLQDAAKLIRADLGTDVIAVDAGGWDLHANYGTVSSGLMQTNIDGLAQSLAAFLADLGELRSRVTVVTISEFGRRLTENGAQGFDHGWGNMMLVLGAGVRGGQYYGRWPPLAAASLVEGDLKVTTDYRDVLGEVVSKRFPDRSLSTLFPGLSHSPLGFMRAA